MVALAMQLLGALGLLVSWFVGGLLGLLLGIRACCICVQRLDFEFKRFQFLTVWGLALG